MQAVIGWFVRAGFLIAIVVLAVWILTHPDQTAAVILGFFHGVARFVQVMLDGIAGMFN